MAVSRFWRYSATFVVFMVVVLLLQTHVQSIKIVSFSSLLAVAAKLDIKHFPGRNSGLHRCPHASDLPPLCKLQAGLKLLNISLAASLVVLAADVSRKLLWPIKKPQLMGFSWAMNVVRPLKPH